MAKTVSDALQRAAARSARRAELESAKLIVERGCGYPLDEEQYGWFSVLSMPEASAHVFRKPCSLIPLRSSETHVSKSCQIY